MVFLNFKNFYSFILFLFMLLILYFQCYIITEMQEQSNNILELKSQIKVLIEENLALQNEIKALQKALFESNKNKPLDFLIFSALIAIGITILFFSKRSPDTSVINNITENFSQIYRDNTVILNRLDVLNQMVVNNQLNQTTINNQLIQLNQTVISNQLSQLNQLVVNNADISLFFL